MARATLECSHEHFHEIQETVDRTRESKKTVIVSKAALAALLRDHSKLIRLHRGELDGVL